MSRIVVTGGAGFIGSHLCEALLRGGHEVVALDNFDEFYDPVIKRANLATALEHRSFSLIEGDIRDEKVVQQVLGRDINVVMHFAARAGVRPSIEAPRLYAEVNVGGTLTLLEACRNAQIDKFIFASSSSVYGNNEKVPFSESDGVDHPISPYAATKRAGELMCHTYHHLFDIHVTCLRLFTVYGPRQRPDLAIHKFTRLIDDGEPIPVYGDGSMMRDFTYIDDIVAGIERAISRCSGYHVYNLGGARPVSLLELIAGLERALNRSATVDHQPLQPGDVRCTSADVSMARRELGFKPSTDMVTGLQRFVAWYRNKQAREST